jgi:hypothetical protein
MRVGFGCTALFLKLKGYRLITLFPDGTAAEGNIELIRLDEIDFFKKREGDKQFTPVVMGCVKYRFGLDDKRTQLHSYSTLQGLTQVPVNCWASSRQAQLFQKIACCS